MSARPALVTGASSGIGREAAILLSRAGCVLLLTGRRFEALEETARQCEGGATVFAGDLADPGFAAELAAEAAQAAAGGLPILVNAAGCAHFGPTHEMEAGRVREQLLVNLLAPIQLVQAMLPWMLPRGGGDIVNVASVAAVHAFPQAAGYVASKHGLLGFSRSLAAEYRERGLRVTTILPGSTDTPLWSVQSFRPEASDMLPVSAVAEAICDAALAPRDRSYDEIRLMPPKGILSDS
jgi:short-subunit dehydrogenase